MAVLIKNLPFLLLIYLGWDLYESFNFKNEEISRMETEEKSSLEKNIKDLKIALKKSQAIEGQIEAFRARIGEVSAQIEQVQKQLPETIVETDILDMFAKETNLLNIKDVTFTPGSEISKDFYITKKYEIKGRGTHLQFLVFFERLRKMERIYNVDSIKISTPVEGSKGRFHLVDLEASIEAYRYNSKHSESLANLEKEAADEIAKEKQNQLEGGGKRKKPKNEGASDE